MNERYWKALSRTDLSQWLVHLTKEQLTPCGTIIPLQVLVNILHMGKVLASKTTAITKYDRQGAACFYDVPPQNWKQLIETNPSGRKGYGLIVSKTAFWLKGGRPAIYTDQPDRPDWPNSERYRLINTSLNCYSTDWVDWMHEREWRICGDLTLDHPPSLFEDWWWWPCVERIKDAQYLFRSFPQIVSRIYVIELGNVIDIQDIFI